jgi:aminoglycoside/choline kinase family phosphotransferase
MNDIENKIPSSPSHTEAPHCQNDDNLTIKTATWTAPGCACENETIHQFLSLQEWHHAMQQPLPQDCSTRRYIRLKQKGTSCLLMVDQGPGHSLPDFLTIAHLLKTAGFRSPQIYATDGKHLALIEDFGDLTYTRQLNNGTKIEKLYETAIDVLVALRKSFNPNNLPSIPTFNQSNYLTELDIFAEWYYPALMGHPLAESSLKQLKETVAQAWDALNIPQGLFLKDMHLDTLIDLKGITPLDSCGLLDFQDARLGPAIYDLTSLLQDSRSPITSELMQAMKERYFSALPDLDRAAEERAYHVTGAQRNIKNLGVFARMHQRNKQPKYLQFIPRLWDNLEENLRHEALSEVKKCMDDIIPSRYRSQSVLKG